MRKKDKIVSVSMKLPEKVIFFITEVSSLKPGTAMKRIAINLDKDKTLIERLTKV